MYLATLLQETLTTFRPPDTIDHVTGGVIRLRLRGNGELFTVPGGDSLPEGLAAALGDAIDSVARRGGIGPVLPPPPVDSMDLRLLVHWASGRTPFSIPLMRLSPPPFYHWYQVDTATVAERGNPEPEYPEHLRDMNFEGEVLVEMVVDERGHVEMESVLVRKAAHPDFAKAVLKALRRMRFVPAVLDGCRVPQFAILPLRFDVSW